MGIVTNILTELSLSNAAIGGLTAIIVVLVVVLYATPNIERRFVGVGRSEETITARLVRQYQALQSSDRPFKERINTYLYRDGDPNSPIVVGSDFFLFVRFVIAAACGGIGFVIAVALQTPPALLLVAIGYIAPSIVAGRHNKARRAKIMNELPLALHRLQTWIASGTDLRDALAKVAYRREGPLYAELRWASRQMAIPGQNQYEVLRALDERNDIIGVFSPLADQMERAARRSSRDAREVALSIIDRYLDEENNRRQIKIAGVANKVTVTMIPFLIGSLALSLAGPFLASIINGVVAR